MSAIRDGKRKVMFLAAVMTVPLLLLGLWQTQSSVGAEESGDGLAVASFNDRQAAANEQEAEEYWTAKRMRQATPMSAGYVVDPDEDADGTATSEPLGPPVFVPGSEDGSQTQAASKAVTVPEAGTDSAPQHGTKPTNPVSGPYGPFQRWSATGKYTTYPLRAVGKLFFTLNGGGFVCSASAIGDDEIITAGHCVSDGTSTFATSMTYCPAYNASGANPAYGCWDNWQNVVTTNGWHVSGDPDRDYAVLVFGNDGVCNCLPGNATGWLGYGWNWGPDEAEMALGYPAGAPFPGNRMIQTSAADWYTHDFTAGGQVSKAIGNDMTGGSSGGPWVIGFRHQSAEVVDTDNSSATDPPTGSGPWVNGVNSHKRCVTSCAEPPTSSTNGVFWQEMLSPPFEDNGANDDVQSIIDTFP